MADATFDAVIVGGGGTRLGDAWLPRRVRRRVSVVTHMPT